MENKTQWKLPVYTMDANRTLEETQAIATAALDLLELIDLLECDTADAEGKLDLYKGSLINMKITSFLKQFQP